MYIPKPYIGLLNPCCECFLRHNTFNRGTKGLYRFFNQTGDFIRHQWVINGLWLVFYSYTIFILTIVQFGIVSFLRTSKKEIDFYVSLEFCDHEIISLRYLLLWEIKHFYRITLVKCMACEIQFQPPNMFANRSSLATCAITHCPF